MWLGLRKQVLSTQNTLVHIMATISYSVCAMQNLLVFSNNKFLMDFCIYDDILDTMLSTDKKLLCFKLSKLGYILHVKRLLFLGPVTNIEEYNYNYCSIVILFILCALVSTTKQDCVIGIHLLVTYCQNNSSPILRISNAKCIFHIEKSSFLHIV